MLILSDRVLSWPTFPRIDFFTVEFSDEMFCQILIIKVFSYKLYILNCIIPMKQLLSACFRIVFIDNMILLYLYQPETPILIPRVDMVLCWSATVQRETTCIKTVTGNNLRGDHLPQSPQHQLDTEAKKLKHNGIWNCSNGFPKYW